MTELNKKPNKKQLEWQCRRGMLELDVILMPFLERHFELLDVNTQQAFVALLKEADPDIYTWIMGFGKCEQLELLDIIQVIRKKMLIA